MGASERRMEWSMMMASLLLSAFPFYSGKWEGRVNNHVGCECRGGGRARKIGVSIRLMCHGGWHC